MARPRVAAGPRRTTAGAADIDLSDVPGDLRRAVGTTLHAAGVDDGHLGVEIVGEGRMRTLNYAARGVDEATDVLAFPIDPDSGGAGLWGGPGPRELGDVFICPDKATDLTEAAVHGTLHLCGFDHETDTGEMLELQAKVMALMRGGSADARTRDSATRGESEEPPAS